MADFSKCKEHSMLTQETTWTDADDLADVDNMSLLHINNRGYSEHSSARNIRRRSSKACDQCRKSKCKCERSPDSNACKNCIILGTACTFEGPSKKRGPPKGYIDAIEARLHQMEALLGVFMSLQDDSIQRVLGDLKSNSLAQEILNYVDDSHYGPQGRIRHELQNSPTSPKSRLPPSQHTHPKTKLEFEQPSLFATVHPSNEWQDEIIAMLSPAARGRPSAPDDANATASAQELSYKESPSALRVSTSSDVISPAVGHTSGDSGTSSPLRRQRRKLGTDSPISVVSESSSGLVSLRERPNSASGLRSLSSLKNGRQPIDSVTQSPGLDAFDIDDSSSDDELPDAVGQLSLSEEGEVRFHSKTSGLHILSGQNSPRNESGIWQFPSASVWPSLPVNDRRPSVSTIDDAFLSQLPDITTQHRLLRNYFSKVHPAFPIIHKESFWELYNGGHLSSEQQSPLAKPPINSTSLHKKQASSTLLFSMFALAESYPDDEPPLVDSSKIWASGDEYPGLAKAALATVYSSSRLSTCQALLLMGYKEIGIGAMTQAWIYIGIAIRMAQDLGLHRSAESWTRPDLGGQLFTDAELDERKRVWCGCVVMDQYSSVYIGRPLAIHDGESDNTPLRESDSEEQNTGQVDEPELKTQPDKHLHPPWPTSGRIDSCFNASSRLATLAGMVVQIIYATVPIPHRLDSRNHIERLLDKWYLDLPVHLRYDPASPKHPTPAPNVLTLHMQYWCTVLLLHRPFMGDKGQKRRRSASFTLSPKIDNKERRPVIKSEELCSGAANRISSIASLWMSSGSLTQAPVFLCYYIFTAAITHVLTLTHNPEDPQASLGIETCLTALDELGVLWPSAARASEFLRGSKAIPQRRSSLSTPYISRPRKRSADAFVGSDAPSHSEAPAEDFGYLPLIEGNFGASGVPIQDYSFPTTLPSPMADSYFPSYGVWPQPVSTTGVSHLYNSHVVDERLSHSSRRNHSNVELREGSSRYQRFSPYWNDYPNAPQVGASYNFSAAPTSSHRRQSNHREHTQLTSTAIVSAQ